MPEENLTVPIVIGGTKIRAHIHQFDAGEEGEEEVSIKDYDFDQVVDGIKAIAGQLESAFAAVKPKKAGVEFSVELSVESGGVVALFFDGGGKAGLKVNLEW